MRLTRVELFNWDIQANQSVVLEDGVNLLTGENGSGKTSILDAIKVALGATRLGTDRSYEIYLRRRSAPFAMVRLVAENHLDPETRRRPFDALGGFHLDQVTLAVVFEAGDEGYAPRWYLVDGDVSPLATGVDARPFVRKRDYLDRLDKLGMGGSFRRLLCTPQGEIASLCGLRPSELFDLLYDFIGGRQVLEDWQALRTQFDRERRARDVRAGVLRERESELERLRERLKHHQRYRKHRDRVRHFEQALPWARARDAERRLAELEARASELVQTATAAGAACEAAEEQVASLQDQDGALAKRQRDLRERERLRLADEHTLQDEHVRVQASWLELDRLRERTADLPIRDLGVLEADQRELLEERARLRLAETQLQARLGSLAGELERLDEGLLTPPDGVDAFRAVLRLAEVPHQLLMDLLEPTVQDHHTRRALESYLGDLRFAVAVPDLASFRRAVALAREHRFPFHVLAPDVRSNPPREGDHPFLAAVEVREPRYRGLVRRVLRHVAWLEGEVEETFRARGARVDRQGYVLDRTGGRHQGVDDWYLGREALVRRRHAIEEEVASLQQEREVLHQQDRTAGRRQDVLAREIQDERDRRDWLSRAEDHAHLHSRLTDLGARIDDLRQLAEALRREGEYLAQRRRHVGTELGAGRTKADEHRGAQRAALDELQGLSVQRAAASEALSDTRGELPPGEDTPPDDLSELARSPPSRLTGDLDRERRDLADFSEVDRDENLPGNVRTLERQVEDVRGELARLDGQLDQARLQAERAHDQYKTVTRRMFRGYFGQLRTSGARLGLALEGRLRPRDDGRFEVELHVGVGDKAPVAYSSPDLSGGQKAALSILMGMTTLQLHHGDDAAGFFLVDEPFSASDTYKIQELGSFLARTGAQYIVSMPTTSDLQRCGAWLQAVMTCTQTRGGIDERGELRVAPPVKCSYVVHNGG